MLTTVLKSLIIISVMLTLPGNVSAADRPKPIDKITLLGLDLTKSSLDSVRQKLWDIGGFQQARSTVRQRNIDKFFSVSRFKDSYYVEFHYDNAGKVTSAYQLFEYRTIEFQNRRTPVQTRAVALEIMQQIGQPTQVIRKGWGGMPGYNAYIWKNDLMTVEVDREGSEILGNVFVKYTVNRDPYFVADKDKPQ